MRTIIALSLALFIAIPCSGYSVLTHEAVIDTLWASHILPLLVLRFPEATPEQLQEAHAYVYGGCLIQDMGYVPFSSHTISDLAHYVRSGDFVENLIRDSETLYQYAFALGSLAHYAADKTGHPTINRITPLIYAKMRQRFGSVVTYEDNPVDHIKTEFSLDVVQVSRGSYAPDAYHNFIGFQVQKVVLEKAFRDTYGIEMKDVMKSEDLALGTFRYSVGRVIPEMTKVAWNSKRKDILKLTPTATRSKFLYSMPRRKYEREWGTAYREPGVFARFLATVFRLIPTIGPFRPLGFKPVPAKGEEMFLKSFAETVTVYATLLGEVRTRHLKLENQNLDTGALSEAGKYRLADSTYAKLVDKLAEHHFEGITPELRANILTFFNAADRSALPEKTLAQLDELKSAAPVTAHAAPQ